MDARFSQARLPDPDPRKSDPYRSFIYQLFESRLHEYFSRDLHLRL